MSAFFTRSLLCLALVFSAFGATQAAQPKPGRAGLVAAHYALTGKNVDDVDVFGHGFNIYAARSREVNGVTIISGRIAHRLRLRADDQVYYTIKKQGNKVLSVKMEIDRGGLTSYVGTAIGFLPKGEWVGEQIGEQLGKLAGKLDDSWESAAEFIVATIALKARAVGGSAPYDPNNNRPNVGKPVPPPAVSGGVVVRDHREPTFASGGTQIRDHRDGQGGPVIRDHRK